MKLRYIMTALIALVASSAAAQNQTCGSHDPVVSQLAERYGETRQVIALTADQSVMEVFASEETGSWTVTITRAGQPTCLVASGQNYQELDESLPAQGIDG